MKKLFLAAGLPLLLFSCDNRDRDLTGKWQAIKLDNPSLEEIVVEQQQFIDSFGSNTTPEQNDTLYGTRNIDSMRRELQLQVDSFKAIQQQTLEMTQFEFLKNKTAILYFGGAPDSASWYFDDDGALILDELKLKGTGTKTRMEIETLTKDTLRLRFTENGITSSATFRPLSK